MAASGNWAGLWKTSSSRCGSIPGNSVAENCFGRRSRQPFGRPVRWLSVMSLAALQSGWMADELRYAINLHKKRRKTGRNFPVIPLSLDVHDWASRKSCSTPSRPTALLGRHLCRPCPRSRCRPCRDNDALVIRSPDADLVHAVLGDDGYRLTHGLPRVFQ
jgi:hypothetical protein